LRRRPQAGGKKVVPRMFAENNEPQLSFDSIQDESESKHRLQQFFALALLVTALVLVVMKNRQFWLDALTSQQTSNQTLANGLSKTVPAVNSARSRKIAAKQAELSRADASSAALPNAHEMVLPPLQVDVTYASGLRKTIIARNSAVHIDLRQSPTSFSNGPGATTGIETRANTSGPQVRFSGGSVEILGRPKEPIYPLTAQEANVQGSVVLQASIGEDGNVQALQVLSGPSMLTSAAMEAVKQWHFKPHYEAGKAVSTETRITVNFTISAQ
jgi:TonB family protein